MTEFKDQAVYVMDINTLPSEYKSLWDLEKVKEKFEEYLEAKVLFIDLSKQNTTSSNYSTAPIYKL